MRITGGRGLKLSATQCYLATDVEENLRKLYETNALSISFSGETIPICSQDELRLASVLACAYHNSLVRENIEDPTYEPYCGEPEADPATEQSWTKVERDRGKRHVAKLKRLQMLREMREGWAAAAGCEDEAPADWDDEAQGERAVYDPDFERNADLVPWRQERCHHWNIERWGLYV